ncbi:AP-4 complex accessory subunit RUSC1-like isoform X5 [Acipenser ruthenus]|uniref:AP-4 complex accessory subunit RUSC1-like isoform X5 n=1 Tax=Acipenser ruthenus TaxID=7906 RepID=UPI0027427AEF|nr:AP-4 complex accessory subunit RUSC1-like isoform X5 [Acipenser ruthenus]
MLSSALLDNRKWAGKEEPEKQERRELNGNAAPGVGPTSTGKKTRPEKTEENNNNHNNRNHSTGDPERPGHRGEEVRSPGTRGEEVRSSGTHGEEVRSSGTRGEEVRSPGTRGEEVRSPGTRGEEVRSSGTRRHEENGNDDDNRNFKPETDTNCNEPSLPCRCCREHSPPREPGKKTPPETILDEREGQGKPGSLWPPPSCAEPPQSPLEFTLSSSGSSSSSSISSCSDFESDSNPEFPADSRRDAVVGEGGGVLSPDSRRQPDIVPLEQGMEPRCLEEKEKKETETETQQEGLSEVFIPCCSPDEGYPSGHCSRSSSFPELGEGEEEELPDSLAGSPDEDNDGNNQPFSGMSSSGASPCSEPESRDGSKPARSSPPNQSFSFYSSPGPLSRIHGLPGKAPNNIPKLEKVDDPSSQTGWTADRKQAGRIPDIPDVIIKKNKEVPDPDSRDTDPIPGKISDTPGNAALKGKEEDIPAGSSGQRWDSWADVLGGKEGGGKEGRRPLVLDLGGPGYVDRLLGQRSPLLDSRGIPEPQKNVTSFHELARRRRRSGGSANHSAAGGDRERSDWLMVFSPDTELPPRPFGNGNQRAEAEEEEEEGEDRRSSPQKGGSQGGSNVTTFKELRLRNKQNQQRQNWGSCSSDEGAVQMEPEEPPPFPSAWDPFPEEAGGSEPSAAAQPPPPAISFYFQTPSQPPLARRHSRPALQPIAEGAAEDEPRPLGIPPGDGEGERGTADGGRGRESHSAALVNAVSSAVEEILSHFSSSRTLVQKAQSGDSRLNPSLARLVLQALCPALRSLLSDGLKPYQSDLIVGRRRNSPWGLVEASTRPGPSTQGLHLLSSRLCQLPELRNANKRFNAFVFGLLNLKLLDHWLSHLQSSQDMLSAYYSPASFLRLTSCQPLFEELLLLLQPLSLLTFHLDLLFEHHHLLPANQDGHRASSANQIPRGSALANRGPDGKGTANQDSPGLANGSEHTDQGPKPGTANPAPGGGAGPTNQKPASRKEAGSSGPANQSVLFPVEWELGGAPPSAGRPLSQQAGQALQSGWKQIVQWGGGLGQNWAGSDRASRIRAGEGEVSWWDKLSQNPWVSLSPTQTQNWGKDPRSCTETQSGTSPDTRGTDAEAPPPRPDGSGAGQRAPVGSEVKGAQFWMLGRLFGASLGDSKPATQEQKLRRPSSWLSPSASVLRAIRTGAAAQRGGERSGPETSPKQTDTQNPGLRAVRTLCDYQGSGAELSFRKGEELPLVGAVDEEWIRCRQGDREGLVPIGFASLIM